MVDKVLFSGGKGEKKMKGWGMRLKQLRVSRGLRQEDVSEKTGVNKTALSKMEHETYGEELTHEMCVRLGKAFNMTGVELKEYLFGEEPVPVEALQDTLYKAYLRLQGMNVADWFPIHEWKEDSLIITDAKLPFVVPSGTDKKNVVCIRCHGGFLPTLPAGSYCFVDAAWYNTKEPRTGQAVVYIKDGEFASGIVKIFGSEKNILNNMGTVSIEEVEIYGKILAVEHGVDNPNV